MVCLMSVMTFIPMTCDVYAAETNNENAQEVNDVAAKIDEGGNLTINGITNAAEDETVWNQVFEKYRGVITGLSGIGAITMIVFFIINFMKLGATSGNPQARTQALVGVLWTGLAAAGLGAVTIITGFFYNIL